jgi:hypothetical protein
MDEDWNELVGTFSDIHSGKREHSNRHFFASVTGKSAVSCFGYIAVADRRPPAGALGKRRHCAALAVDPRRPVPIPLPHRATTATHQRSFNSAPIIVCGRVRSV